jgi:hypothetical protein
MWLRKANKYGWIVNYKEREREMFAVLRWLGVTHCDQSRHKFEEIFPSFSTKACPPPPPPPKDTPQILGSFRDPLVRSFLDFFLSSHHLNPIFRISFKILWRWFIGIIVVFLDVTHRPVFYLKCNVWETGFCFRLHVKIYTVRPNRYSWCPIFTWTVRSCNRKMASLGDALCHQSLATSTLSILRSWLLTRHNANCRYRFGMLMTHLWSGIMAQSGHRISSATSVV